MSEPRPKRYPPPEFPPRRPALFATTPPAVFPVVLGLIGLGLALRRAAAVLGFGAGLAELALGLTLGLWVLAVVAIKVKVWRRFGVLAEDLRPLPGRAGMAAAAMSGMAMGAVVAPYAPGLGLVLILGSLVAHLVLAGMVLRVMRAQGAEGLVPNPTWHLSFTGIVVAMPGLASLGWGGLAAVIGWLALISALTIWLLSLAQLWREVPPAPLRPMLAIHLAPAALLSLGFGALGMEVLQLVLLALGLVIAVALVASGRWILVAGFSPSWGALTFPLAALAQALLAAWAEVGLVITLAALVVNPWIAWRVLKLWPGGQLATKTNAARA
ncbi:tellurium resistance protein [Stagnihabitans tardus]|uniref:Tellurium resistance protein n=1 Tax=Stagnihabitans tardus TaxID=2699202 RepID=A0AAE4Y945_9RHOB|nr:tellurium resistance protein [Stagnihabitans tardus]NBZ87504.1 tellurium resistance protein [Stagnihabitans tardus]